MRRTEYGKMDFVFLYFVVHIFVVHTPHTVFILYQIGKYYFTSVIFKHVGKTNVSRRMQKYRLSRRGKTLNRCRKTSQHTIFVSDVLCCKTIYQVALLLPMNDTVVILLGWFEITKGRMVDTVYNMLLNRWHCGKVHICHPHRNAVKAVAYLCSRKRNHIHRQSILSSSVHYCRKIVSHFLILNFFQSSFCRNLHPSAMHPDKCFHLSHGCWHTAGH